MGCESVMPGGMGSIVSTDEVEDGDGEGRPGLGRGMDSVTSPPSPSARFCSRACVRRAFTTSIVEDSRVCSAFEDVACGRTVAAWGFTTSGFEAGCVSVVDGEGSWERAFLLVGLEGGG